MPANTFTISGQIVNLHQKEIFPGTIKVENGKIQSITKTASAPENYILPGFIDAHVHIESSMLVPAEFARLAVVHGTVATVSDPHEIANVLGIKGIDFMIENGKTVPFKFYFGASSCVPATGFESSGANLGADAMEKLLSRPEIKYMAEMMNYPGVLFQDKMVMEKLAVAKKYNKPIDGHAPGLKGEDARKYIEAGITTDHECFTMEEALDKIQYGMKIQIREGSAAKNFEALIDLMENHADKVLFCSDDKHPDDLVKGHINQLVKRAVEKGYPVMDVLSSAILNPIEHYKLEVGTLQMGDPADMIVVDNLNDFNVLQTYVNGQLVAKNGQSLIETQQTTTPNNFVADPVTTDDFFVENTGKAIKVIEALEGQLITNTVIGQAVADGENLTSNTAEDILKIAVINRYKKAKPAIGFIKNIGLKRGAIASTVAHDSHNIIVVGADDAAMAKAVNLLIESKGGVVACDENNVSLLPLPVAGLMSNQNAYEVAKAYEKTDAAAKALGCSLHAPFMTLSFMALLVIPQLKLGDKGLFDGGKFEFTDLYAEVG
ncbi:MAG: adenine deaminase [Bacteroidetes bacterium]|nr:adenine deaminase [Bacteroidota bacterium]MBU1578812.1 adenine deaminase [Bacteroidota bacterium]MBU2464987.1 adenine deaminase [Bacteroidota bacterium]MBU2558734.1 adenine deaminase [Bacteroidota bacterium]